MIDDRLVEEGFVPILERHQEDVTLDIGRFPIAVLDVARDLFFLGLDPGWQQTVKTQTISLFLGERRASIEARIVENVASSHHR
jgi:hypothetical protein